MRTSRAAQTLLSVLLLASTGKSAGAPLVKHDPHSYAQPELVRVEHLNLDLRVDFAAKKLIGTAKLQITPGAKQLVLDTRDLTIRKVSAPFKLGKTDPILGTPLIIDITPKTRVVTIDYQTHPEASALQWLESAQTAGKKRPYLLSQSEAINARSWVPIQDSPQIRFTYDATIRVPKDLVAIMSAENPRKKNASGVYRFHMPQPIPAYLLALAVGDIEFRSFSKTTGVYAEPAMIEKAHREFADIPKMIEAVESLDGPYRWSRYDILVLPPSFPYGGMENPRLTFLTPTLIAGDRSLVSVVAHELAHSWSGNLVTNATWDDFWLNEGVTTYIERRIDEKLYGHEFSEMEYLLGGNDLQTELAEIAPEDQGLQIHWIGRNPDDAPSVVPYEKGALFLRLIEETVGRETFDRFLRSYFDRHAFQSMSTERFVEILKAELPVQAIDIDAWIHGPGLPADAPKPRADGFARVDAQIEAWRNGTPPSSLDTRGWVTHQWIHFIRGLPAALTASQMETLDGQFHFTVTGNSEILEAWLERAIDNHYAPGYPALQGFLMSQGRRKYLKPLYTKLAATAEGLALAKGIYAKARPTYHPLSQATIDDLLR
ncbi:MAG TPA: M1 family metallopeptidase [Thermoanaerobaculia bacterium]|nr:M1 family metallopeptidase [Thermoanaerobaculia bacterium]